MIANLPKKEINRIAEGIFKNELFTTLHIRPGDENLIPSIFMPVVFGAFAEFSEEDKKDIGMLYADYKDSAPRSINGYPIFWSVCAVNRHDTTLVWKKVEKMRNQMDRILGKV